MDRDRHLESIEGNVDAESLYNLTLVDVNCWNFH
jgi:hypothetical protein